MRPKDASIGMSAVALAGLAISALVIGPAGTAETRKPPAAMKPAEPAAPANEPAMPPMPKPGPEHAALAKEQGTWETTVEFRMGPPEAPPQVSRGLETDTLCCGGLWLVKDYTSDPSSPPFQGHGIAGFDAHKKRYVAVWIDSESTSPMMSEGSFDPSGKTLTMQGEATEPNGKRITFREVSLWKDDNTRTFTMYMPGPDGKEAPGMTITYKRKT